MLDALTRDCHGLFFSIDINLESIGTAQRACSSATHLIHNDWIAALHALSRGAADEGEPAVSRLVRC